jgi:hypothetical protein
MKIKSQKDFWSGLLFLAIGLLFAWRALADNFGSSAQPGPGYLPFGLGLLLALLGSLTLFKALSIESEGGDPIGKLAWRPLLVLVAALMIFGLGLPRLGLVVGTPLLVLLAAWAGADFRWKSTLAQALLLTLGCWAMFVWGLQLPIPVWPTVG